MPLDPDALVHLLQAAIKYQPKRGAGAQARAQAQSPYGPAGFSIAPGMPPGSRSLLDEMTSAPGAMVGPGGYPIPPSFAGGAAMGQMPFAGPQTQAQVSVGDTHRGPVGGSGGRGPNRTGSGGTHVSYDPNAARYHYQNQPISLSPLAKQVYQTEGGGGRGAKHRAQDLIHAALRGALNFGPEGVSTTYGDVFGDSAGDLTSTPYYGEGAVQLDPHVLDYLQRLNEFGKTMPQGYKKEQKRLVKNKPLR